MSDLLHENVDFTVTRLLLCMETCYSICCNLFYLGNLISSVDANMSTAVLWVFTISL